MTMMRERILPTSSPEQLSVFKGHYADFMETTVSMKRWPLINGIVITEDPDETVPKENIGSYEWPASYGAERVLKYPKMYGTRLEKDLRERLNFLWFELYGDIKDRGIGKFNLATFPEIGSLHVEKAKECLGMDPDLYYKYDKGIWFKPMKNHVYAPSDDKEWNELLRCGYAEKPESIQNDVPAGSGLTCFEITAIGYDWIEEETGIKLRGHKYDSLKKHGRNL